MRYAICCKVCNEIYWISVDFYSSPNALELNDYDPHWDDVCDHIKAGGDYDTVDEEPIEDPVS